MSTGGREGGREEGRKDRVAWRQICTTINHTLARCSFPCQTHRNLLPESWTNVLCVLSVPSTEAKNRRTNISAVGSRMLRKSAEVFSQTRFSFILIWERIPQPHSWGVLNQLNWIPKLPKWSSTIDELQSACALSWLTCTNLIIKHVYWGCSQLYLGLVWASDLEGWEKWLTCNLDYKIRFKK